MAQGPIPTVSIPGPDREVQNEAPDYADISGIRPGNRPALCKRCERFDIQSFARSATCRRGYLLSDVESGAADGCEFCTVLLDSLEHVPRPNYFYTNLIGARRTTNSDLYVHMTLSENYSSNLKINSETHGLRANRILTQIGDRFSEVKSESRHELCLAADPDSAAARSGDVTGRYLGHNLASDQHYAAIKEWIRECSTHSKCNQTVSGSAAIDAYQSPLPTRCIEVPRQDGRAYLRETEGAHDAYITLTHRWNKNTELCKTTTRNYRDRLAGRGLGDVPCLFRHVFAIALKLNVRYVWIDSICIMQDGDDGIDWRREAPKMAQYYQFSLLTIAGTATEMDRGVLHPFLDNVSPWAASLVRLPYRDKSNTQDGHLYVYKRKASLVDDYWCLVRNCHLFRRGWILQEWLLSKRILWYTPNGIFFECHSDTPRTDLQEKIQVENVKPDLRAHLHLKTSFHFSNKRILDFWYHALEVYSGCHLTKPDQDRVLAIAGLAKEVGRMLSNPHRVDESEAEELDEVFVSGLWLRDIHQGLLWEEDYMEQPWTKKVNDAPSWSWTSLITRVKWPETVEGTQSAFQVIGVCLKNRYDHKRPQHMAVADGTLLGRSLFDPANMFSCLHIWGRLHTLHIRGYLRPGVELQMAAFATAYNGTRPTSCRWKAVCSPLRPEIIAGWGSLEQLTMDETSCADIGVAVFALQVSTRYLRTGLLIKRAEPVLDVLFLEEVEEGKVYRRLGVGRIFDACLIREFRDIEHQNIQLV